MSFLKVKDFNAKGVLIMVEILERYVDNEYIVKVDNKYIISVKGRFFEGMNELKIKDIIHILEFYEIEHIQLVDILRAT